MMILLQATEPVAAATAAAAAATEQAAQTMSFGELFLAGGFPDVAFVDFRGVAVFIFFERFWAIRKASAVDVNFMNRIREQIFDGKISAAIQLAVPPTPDRPDGRKGDRADRPSAERREQFDRERRQPGSVEARKRSADSGDDRRRRADDRGFSVRWSAWCRLL